MSPWYVGRFGTIKGAGDFKQRMVADMAYLEEQNRNLHIKRDYAPVVVSIFGGLQRTRTSGAECTLAVPRVRLAESAQRSSQRDSS
jgi:hypothetical protein